MKFDHFGDAPRIHHVSCSMTSEPEGSESFDKAKELAGKLERYARRIGFRVSSDNVDRGRPTDPISAACSASEHEAS